MTISPNFDRIHMAEQAQLRTGSSGRTIGPLDSENVEESLQRNFRSLQGITPLPRWIRTRSPTLKKINRVHWVKGGSEENHVPENKMRHTILRGPQMKKFLSVPAGPNSRFIISPGFSQILATLDTKKRVANVHIYVTSVHYTPVPQGQERQFHHSALTRRDPAIANKSLPSPRSHPYVDDRLALTPNLFKATQRIRCKTVCYAVSSFYWSREKSTLPMHIRQDQPFRPVKKHGDCPRFSQRDRFQSTNRTMLSIRCKGLTSTVDQSEWQPIRVML
jgi:hypothetical protein